MNTYQDVKSQNETRGYNDLRQGTSGRSRSALQDANSISAFERRGNYMIYGRSSIRPTKLQLQFELFADELLQKTQHPTQLYFRLTANENF